MEDADPYVRLPHAFDMLVEALSCIVKAYPDFFRDFDKEVEAMDRTVEEMADETVKARWLSYRRSDILRLMELVKRKVEDRHLDRGGDGDSIAADNAGSPAGSLHPIPTSMRPFVVPITKKIKHFANCEMCFQEMPVGTSLRKYGRLECGMTDIGFQVWYVRHNVNVLHIDFQGQTHPYNNACVRSSRSRR